MFLVATLVIVLDAWREKDPEPVYLFAGIWAVAPPLWFWVEYFYIYRKKGDKDAFELFKHGQQVSAAIWAGVALSLLAAVSSEHFKSSGTPAEAQAAVSVQEQARDTSAGH